MGEADGAVEANSKMAAEWSGIDAVSGLALFQHREGARQIDALDRFDDDQVPRAAEVQTHRRGPPELLVTVPVERQNTRRASQRHPHTKLGRFIRSGDELLEVAGLWGASVHSVL